MSEGRGSAKLASAPCCLMADGEHHAIFLQARPRDPTSSLVCCARSLWLISVRTRRRFVVIVVPLTVPLRIQSGGSAEGYEGGNLVSPVFRRATTPMSSTAKSQQHALKLQCHQKTPGVGMQLRLRSICCVCCRHTSTTDMAVCQRVLLALFLV